MGMKYFISFFALGWVAACSTTNAIRKPAQVSEYDQAAIQTMYMINQNKAPAEHHVWVSEENPYKNRYFVCVNAQKRNFYLIRGDQLYYQRHRYLIMHTRQDCRLLDESPIYQEPTDI